MKHLLLGMALAAGLQSGFAGAQAASQPLHGGHGAKPAQPAKNPRSSKTPTKVDEGSAYRSPFADYRAFTPQEPAKDWRAANDEVRDVGGHIGLMKGKAEGAQGGKP